MNEYLSFLADIRQAITYAKYDNYASCSGHEDKPFMKSPAISPWLGPNPFAAPADMDLSPTVPIDTTPGKKHPPYTAQQGRPSSSVPRADGVATVQPGLDSTPSSLVGKTRQPLVTRSGSEDGM